jgi:TatD DNase family protein
LADLLRLPTLCLPRVQSDALLQIMFIDTHTHLFLPEFDSDRDAVIKRAVNSGVLKMFLPNIDTSSIRPMLDISEAYPDNLYPMMGLHPGSVKENYMEELRVVEEWLTKGKFYAIGETGIDLYWDKSHLKEQQDSFIQHIRFARIYNLPLIIHSRESFDEIFRILNQELTGEITGIFHSFTGTFEQAKEIFNYGFKIGIGGIVTFKNSGLDQVIAQTGADQIVLETDSPYLAPVPERGKRNEPSYLLYTAQKIANILGMQIHEIERITTRNALSIYRLQHKIDEE